MSVPTDESTAWDTAKNADDGGWASAAAATQWESPAATADLASTTPSANTTTAAAATTATPAEPPKSTVIPQGTQKTWASMLRQSTAPKAAPQPPKEQSPPKVEPVLEPLPAAAEPPAPEPEPEPVAELSADPPQHEEPPMNNATVVVPEIALPPSKDQLTETNLEQVVDISNPPVTDTAASEAADSWDPRAAALSATATPLSAAQAQHQPPKAPASGYAATAIKATERAPVPRTPSHQRRFLDQQEAVRMPVAANQQLERTAVQFGAFNLNGSEDDIDGDREEPETRAQPPADSPVTQPRASLPPAPPAAVPDAFQKPASTTAPTTGPTGISFTTSQSGGHSFQNDLQIQRANTSSAAQAPPTGPAAQQASIQGSQTHSSLHFAPSHHARFDVLTFSFFCSSGSPAPHPACRSAVRSFWTGVCPRSTFFRPQGFRVLQPVIDPVPIRRLPWPATVAASATDPAARRRLQLGCRTVFFILHCRPTKPAPLQLLQPELRSATAGRSRSTGWWPRLISGWLRWIRRLPRRFGQPIPSERESVPFWHHRFTGPEQWKHNA